MMRQHEGRALSQHALRRRLDEALRELDADAPDLAAVSDAVADALDQAQALELTAALSSADDVSACTVVAARQAEPLTEWLLIPFGQVEVEHPLAGRGFVFTAEHAESAKRWFDALGRKLAIDYEHQSFEQLNGRADGLRPAAGWIGGLDVRDDGLWAVDVSWTDRAKSLLSGGEYRYFSPVIYWTDADCTDVAALGPVALTNDPAMHGVPALAAGRLHADLDAEAMQRALARREDELAVLRKRLRLQEADAFVERGMRLGKITDATSVDWREEYLHDAKAAEMRLSRAPVLYPPGRLLPTDDRGRVLPEVSTTPATLRRGAIEAEDLATYERVVADGRVTHGGAWR